MTEFTRACADHGFACRHLKLVFQCMDTDGAGTIDWSLILQIIRMPGCRAALRAEMPEDTDRTGLH